MSKRAILAAVLLLLLPLTSGCFNTGMSLTAKTGPLVFDELRLSKNSIGTPEIHVTVTNTSTKGVKAFVVEAECENAYGYVLKRYGYGDMAYRGIYQTGLDPGETRTVTWTLYGFDTAYKIRVKLESTIDVNDRKWLSGGMYTEDDRYIKTATF